jgi:hypothetical protein
VEQRVVTLRELLGDATPALPAIQAALAGAFADRFGLAATAAQLSPEELEHARTLYDDEIGTDAFVNGVDEPPVARGDLVGRRPAPAAPSPSTCGWRARRRTACTRR